MAPVLIVQDGRGERRYVVTETRMREVHRRIVEKASRCGKYEELTGEGERYDVRLSYRSGVEVSMRWNVSKPRKEARELLRVMQKEFTDLAKVSVAAPGMPSGELKEYHHVVGAGSSEPYSYDLNRTSGKRRLRVL